ncbi:hypothetical protein C8J57DRAFT_1540112 [Mycena rebaudengoi]|nr:hypothetical protein C8J57DRAFT_1540112 [Mycena rebaudengoi]
MATQGWVPPSKKATRKAREQSVSIGSPRAQTPPVDVNTPIVPATGVTGDITMHDHAPSYLGASPAMPGLSDLGPEATIAVAVAHVAALPTEDWSYGQRTEAGVFPPPGPGFTSPQISDVVADRTFYLLGPNVTTSNPGDRQRWHELTNQLFSNPGLYDRYVLIGKYPFSTNPMGQAWNFAVEGCTLSHLAAWFCAHGIAAGSSAACAMEDFARSQHSHVDRDENPDRDSGPLDTATAQDLQEWEVTPWNNIWMPTLCAGLDSDFPIHPSTPMRERDVPPATLDEDEMLIDTEDKLSWSDNNQTELPAIDSLFS